MTDISVTYSVSGADLRRHYPVSRAIEALIDLAAKIAWFKQGYAKGFAAGPEATWAECDRVVRGGRLCAFLTPCKPEGGEKGE